MSLPSQKRVWWIAAAAFTALALYPIWAFRFPPMQDYPQYLLQTHMLGLRDVPGNDFNRYFELHLRPVYATFYLTTLLFSKFTDVETAGKLSLSLYPALVALLVFRIGRRESSGFAPWGALLLFPFAFNQQYFLGNIEYLLSLPLLLLALLDVEDFLAAPAFAWPLVRNVLWQVVLFVTHPLGFLAYLALASVGVLLTKRRTRISWLRPAAAIGAGLLLLCAFWTYQTIDPPTPVQADPRFGWISPRMSLEFFAFQFTGMQSLGAAEPRTLVLWGLLLAIALGAAVHHWRTQGVSPRGATYGIFLGLSLLGLLVLPFRKGEYSYINVRLAAIAYFLIALLASRIRFGRGLAAGFVLLTGLCTLDSVAKQARISAEIEQVLPVVQAMSPNGRLLPLIFDRGTKELDVVWFDLHVNDYDYYHVLVGGGYNPYLIRSSIHPLVLRDGQMRPSPPGFDPGQFSWKEHAADYDYFLVCGGPPIAREYLAHHARQVASSGPWTLFQR